jgi:hypothetical protein
MTETAKLELLLEKYKFISPVPESARMGLIKSRTRVLKSTLKELGVYSLWFGLVLFILLKLRKIGFKFAITIANIAAITATLVASAAVAGGAYVAVKQYTGNASVISQEVKSAAVESANEAENAAVESQGKDGLSKKLEKAPVYEIFLYNGKKYLGSIESRGATYRVNTSGGQVTIPANQIKLIRRAKE